MGTRKSKNPNWLWPGIRRGVAYLYLLIARSWLGRLFSSYPYEYGTLSGGKHTQMDYRCLPVSATRLRVATAVKEGRLVASVQGFFRFLCRCPLKFWGIFCLFYGLFSVLLHSFLWILKPAMIEGWDHLTVALVMVFPAIPMVFSSLTVAEAIARSRIGRRLFGTFLCLPMDYIPSATPRQRKAMPYLACFFALLAVGASRLLPAGSFLVAVLSIAVFGLIFSYPEVGVLLSTVLLPALWVWEEALYVLAALLLLTWLCYGIKLLMLHRRMRSGLLEWTVLAVCLMMLLSGFIGPVVTARGMAHSVFLFVCLSEYFLAVNLMSSRPYVMGCLGGLSLSAVIVLLLAYFELVPATGLDWMAGSRAGDALIGLMRSALDGLGHFWNSVYPVLLMAAVPLLYMGLVNTKRLLHRIGLSVLLLLLLLLLVLHHSLIGLLCVAAMTLLYFLLLDRKYFVGGLLFALPALCVALWGRDFLDVLLPAGSVWLDAPGLTGERWAEMWQITLDYPTGVGVGAISDSGNLLFEILHNYGWQGLILLVLVVFLFLQKSFTALRYANDRKDRTVILVGVTALLGVMLYGTAETFLVLPAALLTLILIMAPCSAYANVVFDENMILMAEACHTETAGDRIFRFR